MKKIFSNMKIKLFLIGIILLLIALSSLYWYFAYHIKTPEYAWQMVQTSIEKHDIEKFNKYIDEKALVNKLSQDIIENMLISRTAQQGDTRLVMQEYAGIFQEALGKKIDEAVNLYVKTGKWEKDTAQSQEQMSEDAALIDNLGLNDIKVIDKKLISIDEKAGKAIYKIDIQQTEIAQNFSFTVLMERQSNGVWKIVQINNFSEFLTLLNNHRRQYMHEYVEKTDALMQQHKKTFSDIQNQLNAIISKNSIGSDAVRNDLKTIINTNMVPHWKMLKEALTAINAPKSASTLQKLRLRICDLYLEYYTNYSKWLDDKNIQTLRAANKALNQAKILESNENNLTNIVKKDILQ